MALISLSLVANDIEPLFSGLICHPYRYGTFVQIVSILPVRGLYIFLLSSLKHSLCILDMIPLSDVCLANILSCSVVSLFIFFIVSFTKQKFLFLFYEIQCISSFYGSGYV